MGLARRDRLDIVRVTTLRCHPRILRPDLSQVHTTINSH